MNSGRGNPGLVGRNGSGEMMCRVCHRRSDQDFRWNTQTRVESADHRQGRGSASDSALEVLR